MTMVSTRHTSRSSIAERQVTEEQREVGYAYRCDIGYDDRSTLLYGHGDRHRGKHGVIALC
jgi:hypothetical protein